MSSRLITALNEVTLGCSVWSAERRHSDDLPVGGVVVAMESVPDETGEIRRFYKTVDPYRRKGAVHLLNELEVDLSSIEGPEHQRLNKLVRRMAQDVAEGRGTLMPEHAQLVDWMHVLVRETAA